MTPLQQATERYEIVRRQARFVWSFYWLLVVAFFVIALLYLGTDAYWYTLIFAFVLWLVPVNFLIDDKGSKVLQAKTDMDIENLNHILEEQARENSKR